MIFKGGGACRVTYHGMAKKRHATPSRNRPCYTLPLFYSFLLFLRFLIRSSRQHGVQREILYYIPTDWRQSLFTSDCATKTAKRIYTYQGRATKTHARDGRLYALHVQLLHTPLHAMGAEWPLINQSSVQDTKAMGGKAIYHMCSALHVICAIFGSTCYLMYI